MAFMLSSIAYLCVGEMRFFQASNSHINIFKALLCYEKIRWKISDGVFLSETDLYILSSAAKNP